MWSFSGGSSRTKNPYPRVGILSIHDMLESFNDWGGRDVTNLSPFGEGTARKQPLPGTYLTNPLVK